MNIFQATLLTIISLFAFAANSVLCRLALNTERVHPVDFTAIRILSAALTLALIIVIKNKKISVK